MTCLGTIRKVRLGKLPPVNLERQAHLERPSDICLSGREAAEYKPGRNTEIIIQMKRLRQNVERCECEKFLRTLFLRCPPPHYCGLDFTSRNL